MEKLNFEKYRNEVLEPFNFLDLCNLKKNIDYILAMLPPDTDFGLITDFLFFNEILSSQITAYLKEEIRKAV